MKFGPPATKPQEEVNDGNGIKEIDFEFIDEIYPVEFALEGKKPLKKKAISPIKESSSAFKIEEKKNDI